MAPPLSRGNADHQKSVIDWLACLIFAVLVVCLVLAFLYASYGGILSIIPVVGVIATFMCLCMLIAERTKKKRRILPDIRNRISSRNRNAGAESGSQHQIHIPTRRDRNQRSSQQSPNIDRLTNDSEAPPKYDDVVRTTISYRVEPPTYEEAIIGETVTGDTNRPMEESSGTHVGETAM